MMVILEVTLGLVLGIIILALLPALLRGAAFLAGVLILVALATAAAWLIADNWPYSLYFSVGMPCSAAFVP